MNTTKETIRDAFPHDTYGHWYNDDGDGKIHTYYNPGKRKEDKKWFVHRSLSFGDYDTSAVAERANVEVFKEKYEQRLGTKIQELHLGYGSTLIALRYDVDDPEIIECLNALCEYSIISEDAFCEKLEEMIEERIDDMSGSDFDDLVENHFPDVDFSYIEDECEGFRKAFREFRAHEDSDGHDIIIQAGGTVYLPPMNEIQSRRFLSILLFGDK